MKRTKTQLQVVTTKVRTRRKREVPVEGHICRGKFHRREVDHPTVFVFQGNISYDAADVECKGGGGVIFPFALQALGTFQCDKYLSLNRARLPVWHISSEDGQECNRAGGTLLALS